MKNLFLFIVLGLASSSASFASTLDCRLVNALGQANIVVNGTSGVLGSMAGDSPITYVQSSSLAGGAVQRYDITYASKISGGQVTVALFLVASPVTGIVRGGLFVPVNVPGFHFIGGPFTSPMPGLNPFGPFVPGMVPVGYSPWAAATCEQARL